MYWGPENSIVFWPPNCKQTPQLCVSFLLLHNESPQTWWLRHHWLSSCKPSGLFLQGIIGWNSGGIQSGEIHSRLAKLSTEGSSLLLEGRSPISSLAISLLTLSSGSQAPHGAAPSPSQQPGILAQAPSFSGFSPPPTAPRLFLKTYDIGPGPSGWAPCLCSGF